jgi:anti-sigma regulatory factor (Ser/Thr protein kinase)
VVEHAYGGGGGQVSVHLMLEPPDVVAVVDDAGSWRPPRGEFRGRGLTLMRALADDVQIDRTEGGTRVVIRRALAEGGSA